MAKLSLIQTGIGNWGRHWMEVVRASPEFSPAGYVCRPEDGLIRVKDVPVFSSLPDALQKVRADALLVTTPCFCHERDATAGLAAGLHVLVEKPMAESLPAARQMLSTAKRHGRILMVSEDFRYNPAPRTVRKLVAEGAIGKPELALIEYFRPHSFPADDWRSNLPHPLLLENGVHHFDLLRYIIGADAREVFATAWRAEGTTAQNTAAITTVKLDNGSMAVYTAAWAYDSVQTDWLGRWKIAGSQGTICWEGASGRVMLLDRSGTSQEIPLMAMERCSLEAVLAEFGQAIETGVPPETSGTDNFKSFAIAMAAMESADHGRPVALSAGPA